MLYVKTLLELDYSRTLQSAGGLHPAALQLAGKDLLGPEHFAKLERKLEQHEKQLKLSLELRWKKDQPEFKVIWWLFRVWCLIKTTRRFSSKIAKCSSNSA